MTTEAVQYSKEQSTDIVYKKKKRLAKSGKDIALFFKGENPFFFRATPFPSDGYTFWGKGRSHSG